MKKPYYQNKEQRMEYEQIMTMSTATRKIFIMEKIKTYFEKKPDLNEAERSAFIKEAMDIYQLSPESTQSDIAK